MLLTLALSREKYGLARAVMEGWRVAKLTVAHKLKTIDLILLLSSTDGRLLRYMHVFRIMQNGQEKFVSGVSRPIYYVLIIYTFKSVVKTFIGIVCVTYIVLYNISLLRDSGRSQSIHE